MAYNTKPIVTDVDGNPISQYYNKELDHFEPVEGQVGANKVVLYNADGTENNNLSLIPILEKLSQLTGTVIDEDTRKSNEIIRQDNEQLRVQLYNDLMAQLDRIEQIQEQVPETVVDSINDIRDKLGDLTLLDTAEKSNLVLALNEIYNDLVAHKAENIHYEKVNIKDFGAKGDGITDDTEAILNAINALGENGGIVVVPAGTYLYNQTLVINEGITIVGVGGSYYNGSILLYNGNNSAVDIDSYGALKQIVIKKYHNGWDGWNPATPVSGVRMIGSQGRIEDVTIWGFEVGLHFIGENKGCAYNQAFLRFIHNCLIAIKFDATGSGWVNENIIYGGRITVNSNYQDTTWENESWGIYMDSHSNAAPNNNKIFGVSIEGVNNGIRIAGMYNTFFNPRIEIPGTVKIVFQSLDVQSQDVPCRYNWIFGLYGAFTFGTHIFVKRTDGTDIPNLSDNMIIGRGIGLQMTNDSLSFFPSYRQAMIKYDVTGVCFEFWHGGIKIATLDNLGNLKVKGTVSENQTF